MSTLSTLSKKETEIKVVKDPTTENEYIDEDAIGKLEIKLRKYLEENKNTIRNKESDDDEEMETDDEVIFKTPKTIWRTKRSQTDSESDTVVTRRPTARIVIIEGEKITTSSGHVTEETLGPTNVWDTISLGLIGTRKAEIWNSCKNKEINWESKFTNAKPEQEVEPTYKKYQERILNNKTNKRDRIKEIEKNLFSLLSTYSLGHCVAADLQMSRGIALSYREKYDNIEYKKKTEKGMFSGSKKGETNLWKSLITLEKHTRECQVEKLAMSKMGCGLDKLNWNKVNNVVEYLFKNSTTEITICKLPCKDEGKQISQEANQQNKRKHRILKTETRIRKNCYGRHLGDHKRHAKDAD
ncbi:hypothetical protein JTB14_015348 [Gonioctena quinquepunctata]|nr:hypothetical protein JTB14_015348 [Gonioctena quinquepunctata]